MKRFRVVALLCAVVACASLLLVGCQPQTYEPKSKEQTVSAAALGNPGTLRVGVNKDSGVLAGQASQSARMVGIDVDVAAYLADLMGLKVEVIDVGSDPAGALSEGKVDMVLGVDATDEDAGYWKSNPYLQTGIALFGAADESAVPTPDSEPKIAAQASSKSSWRVTNLFGDSSLIAQDDLKAAFASMDAGDARYVASDAVVGTYVANKNGYSDKIIALLQDPSGYCAAVSESNSELQSAVTSGVQALVDGGMMNVIESKWLGGPLNLADITVVKSASDDGKKKEDSKKEEQKDESSDSENASDEGSGEEQAAEEEQPAEEQPAEEEQYTEGEGEAA